MKKRTLLKNSVILRGESDNNTFIREFHIIRKIDEGSSVICYEAYHSGSGRGVLKEFYPADAFGIVRGKRGQLIHLQEFKEAYERFVKAQTEYIEPYKLLLKLKQSADYPELSLFIPEFEIYRGCDKDGNIGDGVYVWTHEPERETFERICDEIHKHPDRSPEYKLVTALTAVETLTKCVCSLHGAGLIHRDIKPSNFGFKKQSNETLTQTLSLFDINSVCSVFGSNKPIIASEGFMEPEARYMPPTNQTDIYSIGAVLFCAVAVTDETKKTDYIYHKDYYGRLKQLIDDSKLIRASEANSHPRLRNILAKILEKCLCERAERYADCEELLDDLKKALYHVLPAHLAVSSDAGKRWRLTDVEKSLDVNKEKNSYLIIQHYLYENPLYKYASDGEINVLVIGLGNYGQKFLDAALQAGQIIGKTLNVFAVSDDPTDKDVYLAGRPALARFFNIDGAYLPDDESYGSIRFDTARLQRDNPAANASVVRDILRACGKRPHHIFVALGDDRLNIAAAKTCPEMLGANDRGCVVGCVCENKPSRKAVSGIIPICVNEDVKTLPSYPEIERMAFNMHTIWEKDLNIAHKTVLANFRKTYNHDSNVAGVLSIKYKLFGMGIDQAKLSPEEAARLFVEKLSDNGDNLKNELIWIEHRRWVTEKLCRGWQAIDDLEECADGSTKDERRKRHICICRSKPNQNLKALFREPSDWSGPSARDTKQLDDLDRMSVELHRMYVRKAVPIRRSNLLSGNIITEICALISNDTRDVAAFREWYACIKDIRQGEADKVNLYKGLKASFLDSAERLPKKIRGAVREQVKAFEALFNPIIASMEYRDWKQNDAAIIENIPFILTYSDAFGIALPYAVGDNTAVFGNVASASVLSPARITYLFLAAKDSDYRELFRTLPGVMAYMKRKKFRASVSFVIFYEASAADIPAADVRNRLKNIGGGRIKSVKLLPAAASDGAAALAEKQLTYLKNIGSVFFLEKNASALSEMMSGAGVYGRFPSYRFDSVSMTFTDTSGCDPLKYIGKKPFITAADMMMFDPLSLEIGVQPELFGDYRTLREIYRENREAWSRLCDVLAAYSAKNDVSAEFDAEAAPKKNAAEYRFIIPAACFKGAEKVVGFLKSRQFADSGSRIAGYTTNSCEVIISDRYGCRSAYEKLFSDVYALMLPESITLYADDKSGKIFVKTDKLTVYGCSLPAVGSDGLLKLLRLFNDKGYILNLEKTADGKVCFTYSAYHIKELLTRAGRMLRVYAYHKLKESGRFDDVVCCAEDSPADCVVTKGFCSLFVKCEANADTEPRACAALADFAEHSGINAGAVIVAEYGKPKRGGMPIVTAVHTTNESRNDISALQKIITDIFKEEK